MTKTPITLTIAGDTCTLRMDPNEYLRVKVYFPGMRNVPHTVLQGKSYERPPYEKRASLTFPLPNLGESLRIDVYDGDGEGAYLSAGYRREESGLVLVTTDVSPDIQIVIEQEQAS